MASPETKALRLLSPEQLARELEETHQALFNLRFQAGTRQLADVSQVRKARTRIARIKTLLTEQGLAAEAGATPAAGTAAGEAPESTAQAGAARRGDGDEE